MATIGNISIGVSAKTAKFFASMGRASKIMTGFGKTTVRVAAKLAKFTAAVGVLGGAAAVGGMALLTRRSFKSIDAMAKLSDQLGMATEALAGLQHAAELTGAGSDTMGKSMVFLAKTLGEATQGIGEGRQALTMLRLEVGDLLQMKPEKQIALIADRFKTLAGQERKAYVATKLFGRSGTALVNTLALGSEGLAKAAAEAEKLGIAVSRIDAVKIEMANDAITRMKSAFKGLANVVAVKIAPAVKGVADHIVRWMTEGAPLAARMGKALDWVGRKIAAVLPWIDAAKAGFWKIAETLLAVGRAALRMFARLAHGMANLMAGLSSIPGIGKTATKALNTVGDALWEASKNMHFAANALELPMVRAGKNAAGAWGAFVDGTLERRTLNFFRSVQAAAEKTGRAIMLRQSGLVQAITGGPAALGEAAVTKLSGLMHRFTGGVIALSKAGAGLRLPGAPAKPRGALSDMETRFRSINLGLIALRGTAGGRGMGREQPFSDKTTHELLREIAAKPSGAFAM